MVELTRSNLIWSGRVRRPTKPFIVSFSFYLQKAIKRRMESKEAFLVNFDKKDKEEDNKQEVDDQKKSNFWIRILTP